MHAPVPRRAALAEAMPWLAGALALGLGGALYLAGRPGGGAGGWLPSALHTLAFALFSAALGPPGARVERRACAAWVAIGLLFELGQHSALAPALQAALGPPLGGYFVHGRFDPADLAATVGGGLLAAVLLRSLRRGRRGGMRPRWQAGVLLAGLGSLVGSGGGFPPCEGEFCDGGPPPALVQVVPAQQIVLAGAGATFRATAQGGGTPQAYRWRRSVDGGQSYADIDGATTATLVLPAVTLADDGLRLQVLVTLSGSPTLAATARLAVSASPGLVFEDTEFADADWTAEPYVPPGGTPAAHDEARVASGGSPGAWRRMHVTVPAGQGSVAVDHLSARAVHDPAVDGAVRVLDYREQCRASAPAEAALLVEQAGRRYASQGSLACTVDAWGEPVALLALGPEDLTLLGSEPCPAGQACPDFSASGAPLRFGFRRLFPAQPGATVEQGIDNWRVTVWRR